MFTQLKLVHKLILVFSMSLVLFGLFFFTNTYQALAFQEVSSEIILLGMPSFLTSISIIAWMDFPNIIITGFLNVYLKIHWKVFFATHAVVVLFIYAIISTLVSNYSVG